MFKTRAQLSQFFSELVFVNRWIWEKCCYSKSHARHTIYRYQSLSFNRTIYSVSKHVPIITFIILKKRFRIVKIVSKSEVICRSICFKCYNNIFIAYNEIVLIENILPNYFITIKIREFKYSRLLVIVKVNRRCLFGNAGFNGSGSK